MTPSEHHIPVLKREVLNALQVKRDGIYLDATLGRAGHAKAILSELGDAGRLIGLDRDPRAIELGNRVFAADPRVRLMHGEFARMQTLLNEFTTVTRVDGILMDLGVSSPQLDQAERGFSFMRDGELDMRMDPTQGESATEWLARAEESELVTVLFRLGEERFARRIAKAIVIERQQASITSTRQLANIIESSIPRKERHKHPATRTFQAIRLHINQELTQLEQALPQAVEMLNEGGRLAVISFHSLEDRIVKRFIRDLATPNLPPKSVPVSAEDYLTPLRVIGRAIKPSAAEVSANPRSRSSVLRVAERTAEPYSAGVACA